MSSNLDKSIHRVVDTEISKVLDLFQARDSMQCPDDYLRLWHFNALKSELKDIQDKLNRDRDEQRREKKKKAPDEEPPDDLPMSLDDDIMRRLLQDDTNQIEPYLEEDPNLLDKVKELVKELHERTVEDADYISQHDPDAIKHPWLWGLRHFTLPMFTQGNPDLTPAQWIRFLKLLVNREKTLREWRGQLETKSKVNKVLDVVEDLSTLWQRIMEMDAQNDQDIQDLHDDLEACCSNHSVRFDHVDNDLGNIEGGVIAANNKLDQLNPVTQSNNSLETLTNTKVILAKLNALGRLV